MTFEEKEKVVRELASATEKLKQLMPVSFIPDAGMNIVYAIPNARLSSDIAAINGRIKRIKNEICQTGEINFGADSDIAGIVLTAMKFDSDIRSAAIIRFSEQIILKAEDLLMEVRSFNREKEPAGISTMDWGVAFCCEEDDVPDIIYDRGAQGKEPLIRILGVDPLTIVNNIIMIAERINNKN
ncbi:MAG: phosphomethylpyrimidine kinase [Methanomicrobiaceae archaeon]|nr:phosphomethylpyrimidine kinase [Methanomicrobiaceae archaeon]